MLNRVGNDIPREQAQAYVSSEENASPLKGRRLLFLLRLAQIFPRLNSLLFCKLLIINTSSSVVLLIDTIMFPRSASVPKVMAWSLNYC